MTTLTLTNSELDDLMCDSLKGFKVLNDDIPKDGHSSQYIERDGRQYRQFEFERLSDGKTFNFCYTWYTDISFEPTHIFDSLAEMNIEIVDDPVVEPEPKPEPILTKEQQDDKDLMQAYDDAESEMVDISEAENKIPKAVIKELTDYLNTGKFNMYELRAKIFPISMEYKITHKSLWTFLQKKRGAWK